MARALPGDVSWLSSLRARWAGMTPTARLVLLGVAALAVSLAGGGALLVTRPDMRPVVSGVSAREADAVVRKLEEMNVPYRLSEGGSTVLVGTGDLYRARLELAGAGVLEQGRPGFELFDRMNLHSSDFAERVNYVRALSGELEETIAAIPVVAAVRVHINLPREAVFLDDASHPTASVLLDLKPGTQLSRNQAMGIRNLVASSVDGLAPESVTLMDTNGKWLLADDESGSPVGGDEEQLSKTLQRSAQQVLDGVLGPGRAVASVRVELLRDRRETRREVVEPVTEGKGLEKHRQDTQETYQGTVPTPTGTPATGGPPVREAGPGERPSYNQRSSTIEYELSRRTESLQESPGKIRRMTASVLLDAGAKLSPEARSSLGDALKLAIGFDESRGDQFDLLAVPFNRDFLEQERQALAAATRRQAEERRLLVLAGAGLVGALGMIGLAILVLGKRKRRAALPESEVVVTVGQAPESDRPSHQVDISLPAEAPVGVLPAPRSREELLGEARRSVVEQPTAVARMIQVWLEEDRKK
ncbi:MAG: flagellar basal-body MS-ring/collar protein FliF [Candidatus Eremiobacterota bacterium]